MAAPLPEYPRPALQRADYQNLNGLWNYAITDTAAHPAQWDGQILVPYSPECRASGVGRTLQPGQWLHYERRFAVCAAGGERVLLHFGAVDCSCTVSVNGQAVGSHRGGYWPFTFDITALCRAGEENTLYVAVQDESDTGFQARGKQTLHPGGMFYPAQSGIWQTVWLEKVPACYIDTLVITPDYDHRTVQLCASLIGGRLPIRAVVTENGHPVAEGSADCGKPLVLTLPDEVFRPWSPENPFLYDVTVTCGNDTVQSYFAVRKWSIEPDKNGILRFYLNGSPIFLNGLLDQGYWPQGLYTPPDDHAVEMELKRIRALGFNLLRKHAKIEPQRWYYHCDRLGLVVWQDIVNGGGRYNLWFVTYLTNALQPLLRHFPDKARFYKLLARPTAESRAAYKQELADTVETLRCHPSIACWVPFNEGWGQFDAAEATAALRQMDTARLVDEASGWYDHGGGDINSIHNYFYPLRVRPGRRVVALSEYGGIAWPMPGHRTCEKSYGYGTARSRAELTARYQKLQLDTVLPQIRRGLSTLVYTQVSDVEEEVNGLFTYDREETKPDSETVRTINEALYREFARCTGQTATRKETP